MAIEIPSQVADRLLTEQNIWLSTTRADGLPLPNTVWFLWRNGEFLVFTVPSSVKMKNLRLNPRVSLNLNTSSLDGSDIAIFQGEANVDCAQQTDEEFHAYLSKYEAGLQMLGISKEVLLEAYVLVRIKPIKFRTVTS